MHKLEARPDNKFADRPGHEDLSWAGKGLDPEGDVHRNAGYIGTGHVALAGVKSHPNLQAQPADTFPNPTGALERPSRRVEGGQEAISGRLDRPAPQVEAHVNHERRLDPPQG